MVDDERFFRFQSFTCPATAGSIKYRRAWMTWALLPISSLMTINRCIDARHEHQCLLLCRSVWLVFWYQEGRGKVKLLFHTFSNTGWLACVSCLPNQRKLKLSTEAAKNGNLASRNVCLDEYFLMRKSKRLPVSASFASWRISMLWSWVLQGAMRRYPVAQKLKCTGVNQVVVSLILVVLWLPCWSLPCRL